MLNLNLTLLMKLVWIKELEMREEMLYVDPVFLKETKTIKKIDKTVKPILDYNKVVFDILDAIQNRENNLKFTGPSKRIVYSF